MSDQNKYAIIGMFAIVITLYALRDSHLHYLPDLFGLALAITAQRPIWAIGAVAVLAMIRHSFMADAFAHLVPYWMQGVVLPGACNMSSDAAEYERGEQRYKQAIAEPENDRKNSEIRRPVAENEKEKIYSAKVQLMAIAVDSGRLGKTEATRLLAGAQSGRKYQVASRRLAAELEQLRNHYPKDSNRQQFE
jgi:hypothetical protein